MSTRGTPLAAAPCHTQVAAIVLHPPGAALQATVGSIVAAFAASGANTTWLPPANAAGLGGLAVPYNLVTWPGGQYEFVSCDLARRGAEYVGTCAPKTVTCAPSSVDGVPYACTLLADNSTVAGNLSSSAYREACELPCDLELDCAALCDCGMDGCASGEVGFGPWALNRLGLAAARYK